MDRQLAKFKNGFFIIFAIYMLIGMHYFQHNAGGSGLHLPFNVVNWIFISTLIGIGLWQATLNLSIQYSALTLVFTAAVCFMLLPVLYADPTVVSESYTRLLGLIGGLLFFITLQQLQLNQKQRLKLLYLILGAVFVEACFSLVQYYLLPVNNWVGYHKLASRPYGIFQQPNVTASFLTTGITLALYLLCQTQAEEKLKRGFCYLVTFLAVIPVILLQSRTGFIALIVAPLMLLPWALKTQAEKNQSWQVEVWLISALLATGLGHITLATADHVARSAATLTNPGARIPIYLHSLEMYLQKPWLGWGYGSFEVNYLTSYSDALSQGLALPGSPENLDHPHNELLYWGIEGGIVPLLGIALICLGFLRIIAKQPLLRALALLGLVFPILLHTQTEYPFYHSVTHWCVFLVLVWYIESRYSVTRQVQFEYTFLLRTSAMLIPLLTTLFMVTTLHTTYLLTKYERSDRRDISPLTKVVNPVAWITRLEFDNMMFRLQIALYRNDKEEINNYITWAAEISQRTPRANIYINWIRALDHLGQSQAAVELMQQTQLMYPSNKLVQSLASQATLSAQQ